MEKENQGVVLPIDVRLMGVRDKVVDIERVNYFFYEVINLILQDKDDDKMAYGAYIFSLQAKKLFNELDEELCRLQQEVIAMKETVE